MALDVVQIRSKVFRGMEFRFAEVRGTPADHASWFSFDDEQELRDEWWSPQAGETVLDIGAAFGSYALPALARGARVVCFSPADFDTELLEKNLSLNPDLQRRCLVVRDGLYSRDGWFDPDHCVFVADHNHTGDEARELYGMIGNRADGGAVFPERQLFRTRSLDSFLDEHPGIETIDWMKIDVEGAELEVLRGAEKTLRISRPNILVENHEFHFERERKETPGYSIAREVQNFLFGLNLGYRVDGPRQHCAVSHSFFSAR